MPSFSRSAWQKTSLFLQIYFDFTIIACVFSLVSAVCSTSCFNGGSCTDPSLNNCSCPRGFTGNLCQTRECSAIIIPSVLKQPIWHNCKSASKIIPSHSSISRIAVKTFFFIDFLRKMRLFTPVVTLKGKNLSSPYFRFGVHFVLLQLEIYRFVFFLKFHFLP